MEKLLYVDIGGDEAAESLDGGEFEWPALKQSDSLKLKLRFTERVGDEVVEVDREVVGLKAGLGRIDARPTAGSFCLGLEDTELTFTVDDSTDVITCAGHPFEDGDRLRGSSTGTFPAGWNPARDVFVINAGDGVFQVSYEAGGTPIDFTGAGTGTHKVEQITEPIAFDAVAADVRAALEDLHGLAAFGTLAVTEESGSWFVVLADAAEAVPFKIYNNLLRPLAFVRMRATEENETWVHEIRLVQTPVAFTDAFERQLPDPPAITELRAGGTVDDVVVAEVQKVTFNPHYRGIYKVERGLVSTELLNRDDGPVEFAEAIEVLADEGGFFEVTNPAPNVGHIKFLGEMAGIDQDLLTITTVDAPPGDLAFTLDLAPAAVAAILRDPTLTEEEIELWLEIEVKYEDPADEENILTWTLQRQVFLRRELIFDSLGTGQEVDWLRPVNPVYYPPFTLDQVAVGAKHYGTTMGSSVVEEITHNLNSRRLAISIVENATPGKFLDRGNDYTAKATGDDTVEITLIGDYDPAPGTGTLFVTILAAEQTSAFDSHEHTIPQVLLLPEALAQIGARLDALELLAPKTLAAVDGSGVVVSPWRLPVVREIVPFKVSARTPFAWPESGLIREIEMPSTILARSGSFVPAVHDAASEAISGVLVSGAVPVAADEFKGRVFQNTGETVLELDGVGGRDAVELQPGEFAACNGVAWYRVAKELASENSWYPTDFIRELFMFTVNENQLRAGRRLECRIGVGLGLLKANTKVSLSVVIELGLPTQETSPATTGWNLDEIEWGEPVVRQDLIVSGVSQVHPFGIKVARSATELTLQQILYGAEIAGTAPEEPNFAVRGRLVRFDVEDEVADPKGFLAITAPEVPEDRELPTTVDLEEFGLAKIVTN